MAGLTFAPGSFSPGKLMKTAKETASDLLRNAVSMQQTATADGEAVKDPELMRHVKSTVPEAVHDVQAIDIGRVPPVTKLSALEKLAAEEVADSLRLARGEMKGCTSHPLPASTATQVSQQLESLLRKAHAELDAIQRDLAASSVRNSPQERVTLQQEQQHVRRTLGEIETARSEEQMELHTRGGISRGLVNMIAALEAEVAVEDAELIICRHMFRSPTHSYAPSVVSDPFATSAPPAFGQPRNNRFSSPPVALSTSSASTRLLPAYSSSAGSNGNRTLPRAPSIPHTQDATIGNRALRDEQLSWEMVRRLEEDYAQESRHEHFEPPPQRRHTGENKQRLRQCANLLRDLHDKLGKLQTEVAAASGGPSHEYLKAMLVKFEGEIERVLDRARGVHQQAQLDLHGRSY